MIYSSNWDDHLIHLRRVQQTLSIHKLYAKRSKGQFGVNEIGFLGLIITDLGVKVDHANIATMLEWPVPINLESLRGFLESKGYCRKIY